MAYRRTKKHDAVRKPQRILLVEDEAILAMDLSHSLTELGFGICAVARTRAEALYHAKSTNPELLLCDITLADNSSGVIACREIIHEIGERPVVFISGDTDLVAADLLPGRTELVTKPFRTSEIVSAIGHVLAEQIGD